VLRQDPETPFVHIGGFHLELLMRTLATVGTLRGMRDHLDALICSSPACHDAIALSLSIVRCTARRVIVSSQ
jgi:hypothetical protein